ncbi:MAG: hypothetical protein NVS2B12_23860 [Ktedonobacteraceae bacterium]
MQQKNTRNTVKRDKAVQIFTASEVAEYEYCPLVWWYEKYDPLVETGTEELFAHLVALEHEHGSQAVAVPEYQVIEQLLVRRGAFEADGQQKAAQAEQDESAAEVEAERSDVPDVSNKIRRLQLFAIVTLGISIVLLTLAFLGIFLF